MPEPAIDRVRCLVQSHADACLADLAASGCIPRPPESHRLTASGWSVLVIAMAAPVDAPDLTECDRACLTLLAGLSQPISGVLARRELEKRGIGIFGLATVKRSLARLKRLDLVCNSRHRKRGYYLPDNLPLFNRLIAG